MKNSNDTIGNRTSDLPACSAVPQTTAQKSTFGFHKIRGISCLAKKLQAFQELCTMELVSRSVSDRWTDNVALQAGNY